jgi:UDP-N-acetylmuramate--alanine ligase
VKRRVQRVHFVGVGGVGMSGLAEILHVSGYTVSGSDLRESATTRRLADLGLRISIGHAVGNAGDADVVVTSSAVPPHNPEVADAEARHIPVIARAEMLSELMRMKYGVAIAGSHGKTTTTSLVGDVLQKGGLDPTIIVGGRVKSLGANSVLGSGDVLVAEADESDGSFLRLIPTVVVVTNVDREHLDHYRDFAGLRAAFLDFTNRIPFWGCAVLCLDDPHVQAMLPDVTRRTRTYGLSAQAEIQADRIEPRGLATRFRVLENRRELGVVELATPGRHNVANALAAIGVGLELEVSFTDIQAALTGFRGVERRFEVIGERDGVMVVDDYAHHPAEIRATLQAARESLERRIVVVFQPHRYSRTRDLFDELSRAFHDADVLLLTEIYPAGEAKLPGVEAEALARAARDHGQRDVHWVREREELLPQLERVLRPHDLLIFMGAGDIGRLAGEFVQGGRAD